MFKAGMRVAAAVIVAVAMLAGAATASAAKLTIKTSDKEVLFGDRISIDGKLAPDAGAAAGENEVRLFEQRFPYETSRVIETTTTNSKGRYEFRRIRPEFNTRYRAAFTDSGTAARSQLIDVYSLPSFTQEGG